MKKGIIYTVVFILCIIGVFAVIAWISQKNIIFSCRVDSIYCNFSVLEKICEMFNGDMGELIKGSSPTVYYSCYNFSHSY